MGGETGKKVGRGFLAVFTLGISEAVMAGMNATDAIGSAGDLMEQLGASIGVFATTAERVGDRLSVLLEDTDKLLVKNRQTGEPGEITKTLGNLAETIEDVDDLFVVERLTPRSESDLWPTELERLEALHAERQRQVETERQLRSERDALIEELRSKDYEFPWPFRLFLGEWSSWISRFSFVSTKDVDAVETLARIAGVPKEELRDLLAGLRDKILRLNRVWVYIADIDNEIHHILFNEPGLAPTTMYNVNEIIERFNTVEQPRIEDIMDSVDDNLEQSKEILEQVKKLFVVKKRRPIEISTLRPIDRARLEWVEKRTGSLESRVLEEFELSDKLRAVVKDLHPVVEIAEGISP